MTGHKILLAVMTLVAGAGAASAQTPPPSAPRPDAAQERRSDVPRVTADSPLLMVEIVIARYQGDKRTSSLPYTLAVAEGRSNLRIGGDVPIPTQVQTPVAADGEKKPAPQSYSYRSIGTNIDVNATVVGADRYRLIIGLEESSVYPPGDAAKSMTTVEGVPAFRSLRTQNTIILQDGQPVEYLAATDRVSGETVRMTVTVRVKK